MKLHNFALGLNKSLSSDYRAFFDERYYKIWGMGLKVIEVISNLNLQKQGVDVILHFDAPLPVWIDPERKYFIRIDEKLRSLAWGDYALELWSDVDSGTLGWARRDLICDYIAYGWQPTGEVRLLHFGSLHLWVERNLQRLRAFPEIRAKNKGTFPDGHNYTTISAAVPRKLLESDLLDIYFEMLDSLRKKR